LSHRINADFVLLKTGNDCGAGKGLTTASLFVPIWIRLIRASRSPKINQLLIGEASSDEFDSKVLNPDAVEIDPPFFVFMRIKKLRLERDQ